MEVIPRLYSCNSIMFKVIVDNGNNDKLSFIYHKREEFEKII
jgi:hypothetical protein